MMRSFENMAMKHKLLLMLLVPIVGLSWNLQNDLRNAWQLESESEVLLDMAGLSVRSSALVHELQKERGMSAGYLGSRGSKFSAELVAQHEQTNDRLQALTLFVESADLSDQAALSTGLKQLEGLSAMRTRILEQRVALGEGIGFYTAANASFLDAVGEMAKLSSIGELNNAATAYVAFLQSKERAGIERAVLSNAFGADRFAPGLFERFQALVTVQDTYLAVFRSLASAEHVAFYETTVSGGAIDEVARMRSLATDRAQSGGFAIDPTYWFSQQTEKINLLKRVEDRLSLDLQANATGTHAVEGWVAKLACAIAL